MKRVLSLLLAMIMVFSLLPVGVFADELPTIRFEVDGLEDIQIAKSEDPDYSVTGETFTVSVYLDNNTGLATFTNSLKWNPKVLRLVGFVKDTDGYFESEVLWAKGWTAECNDATGQVAGARNSNYTGNGLLYAAEFEFIAENGELGLGLQTEIVNPSMPEFAFNNAEGTLTAAGYVIDDSAVAGQSIGIIPYGAPFSAVDAYKVSNGKTESLGSAVKIPDMGTIDVNPWGAGGETYATYYYHVIVPAGTTEVQVKFDRGLSGFMRQTDEANNPQIGSAYASVNHSDISGAGYDSGMAGLYFGDNGDNYTNVIIPLQFATSAWGSASQVKSAVKSDKTVYCAVGPEDDGSTPIAVFSFEYEQAETYEIAIDETMVGGTLTVQNESGETITEASAGESVYVTITPDEGYSGNSYTINGELANDVIFQMPEEDVTLSATFSKLSYKIKGTGAVEGGTVTAKIGDTPVPEAGSAWGENITVEAVPNEGYQLTALTYKAGNGESVGILESKSFEMPKAEVTIVAEFAPIQYAITTPGSDANGTVTAKVGETEVQTAEANAEVTLVVNPKSGYALVENSLTVTKDGVTGEEAKVTVTDNKFTMPANAVTIGAEFAKVPYEIEIAASDNGTVTAKVGDAEAQTATVNDQVTLVVTPDNGYVLDTLSVKCGEIDVNVIDNVFTMPAGKVTVTATFGAETTDEPETTDAPFTVTVDGSALTLGKTTLNEQEAYYVSYPQGKDAVIANSADTYYAVYVLGMIPMEEGLIPWADPKEDEMSFFMNADGLAAYNFNVGCEIEEGNYATVVQISTDDAQYVLVIEATAAETGHTCTYDQEVVDARYLKSAATCQSPAVYYKSCGECGEHSESAETFTSGEIGEHSIESNKCTVCGALNATKLTWWYQQNKTLEVSIQEGSEVDISVGCTPKASGVIGITSADLETVSVSAGEVTTDTNGHATLQITGVKSGEAKVTAYSKIDPTKKAELTVTVTCGHVGTETTTTYAQVAGRENHTAVTVCSCGATVNTITGSCVDEDANGLCDLCAGTVVVPEVSGPALIFDANVHGTWGTTCTFTKLYVDGVTVKSYEWVNGVCTVTLAADTPADAKMTFSVEGLSGGNGVACLYINGSKTDYTANLENGTATVKVRAASKYSIGSMATEKSVTFLIEGAQTVPVERITITPENPRVEANGSVQLSATVYPEDATVKDVTWSTTVDPMYMIVDQISGKVTAYSMGMGQYYTVTATSKSNPEVNASCRVFLDYKRETKIAVSPETLNLKVGETADLTATVTGDQLASNKKVTWSTSDDGVATVVNGKVTAAGAGTATITATSYYGLTAQCTVTVEAAHTCVYDKQIAETKYLKSEANCESPAVYYLSCACGEFDNSESAATFPSGTVVPHSYANEDGTCEWCGQANPLVDIKINLDDGAGDIDLHGIALNLTSGENMLLDLSFENPAEVANLITWISTNEDIAKVIYNVGQNAFELIPGTAGTATISLYDNNDLVATAADEENQTPTPLATFTVTVEEAPIQVEGYSITMDADKPSQMVGEENISVSLKVNHNQLTAYNSYKLELTYDPAVLLLTTATDDSSHINVADDEGTVVITRYGSALTNGTDDIVLNFKAVAPGEAVVTLTKAYISDSDAALTQDAVAAKIIDNNEVVEAGTTVITVGGYDVDLTQDFSSEQTVLKPGEALQFTSNIAPYYDYTVIVKVKNSEGEWTTLPAEALTGAGTAQDPYTVAASYITGNISVTSSEPIGKFYNVAIKNPTEDATAMAPAEGYQTGENKAQYMSEAGYKAVFAPNNTEQYEYTVSVSVGGTPYTCTPVENVYTIPGADIKGNIEFEVTVTPKQVAPHAVTITGSGEEDVVAGTAAATAAHGANYTFNLKMAQGYDYTVTATMGGNSVTATKAETANEDGSFTYTVANVTADLAIVIEKSNLVVEVSEYLDLEDRTMFLITATKTLDEGKSLSYKGNTMFYSEQYKAWAYLVIVGENETLDTEAAKADITVGDTTFNTIPANLDVNKSDFVDINDAQLVYDMYAAKKYTDLTQSEIMEKLLRADTAQDDSAKKLDVKDARAVVADFLH